MLAQSEKRTGVGRSLAGAWPLAGEGAGFCFGIVLLHFFLFMEVTLRRKSGNSRCKNVARLCQPAAKLNNQREKRAGSSPKRKRDEEVNRER